MSKDHEPDQHPYRPFGLSVSQTIGGALAAMAAAGLGTRLGVSGTVLGAALASIATAVLGAIFTSSIRSTAVRRGSPARPSEIRGHEGADRDRPANTRRLVFVVVMIGVVGLMLTFGGVLGLQVAENLAPYTDTAELKRYLHRLISWIARRT